jgi:SPP1 gp7 family putative phage head morphogenesis protein
MSSEPTNTLAIRRDFLREIRRRFRRLRGLVRRTVGYENDALRLKQEASGVSFNAEPKDTFSFATDQGRVEAFNRWFNQAVEDEILEPVQRPASGEHWTGAYVRSGYEKGWKNAEGRLLQEGVAIGGLTEAVFDLPVPKRQVQRLYTRAFDNLRGITDDMSSQISKELSRGLVEGKNPREIADRLTEEITKIQRTRAEVLARTEIINSHSEAALDRYQQAGVDTVSHGEWATAGDSRVCPICMALEGRTFKIPEMRGGTFNFDAEGDDVADSLAGSYQLKPPAHPNGRCTILPVVN